MPTRILTAPAGAVRRTGIRKSAAGPADLHAVFDALPDGIVVWDAEDKLVYVNLTGRTLLAPLDPDLGPGRRWSDLASRLFAACCPGVEDAASALASLAALRCGAQAWLEAALPDGGCCGRSTARCPTAAR